MKKIAVIDCGTNTFNLLVVEATPTEWTVLFHNKVAVKLGEGGFEDHLIHPYRFVRGLDALLVHKMAIDNLQCDEVFAFATSALREATNGQHFIDRAKELFGISIELISGDREAELIYDGVSASMDLGSEPSLIMDIGGGSTEFVIADAERIYWKKSFLLGVSRLHDRIQPSDRIAHGQLSYLEELLHVQLAELKAALEQYPVQRLIGSSGSFDTLRAMHYRDTVADTLSSLHIEIPLKGFHIIHHWLLGSSLSDRQKHAAIPSLRAEYMPLAAHLVFFVLQLHPFKSLVHSACSLKEGAMKSILGRVNWALESDVADTEIIS